MIRAPYQDELVRLKDSRSFARSATLMKLLQFLLENTYSEAQENLKETYIGTVFYGRSASYDPQVDSIVRVNVNRLRHRLEQYYVDEGANNPARISIPRGMYSPVVTVNHELTEDSCEHGLPDPAEQTMVIPVEVMPIEEAVVPSIDRKRRRFLAPLWLSLVGIVAFGFLLVAVVLPALRTRVVLLSVSLYREMFHRPPAFTTARLQPVPITMGAELEFEPNTTADGKSLAYVSRLHGTNRFQIFLRREGKGEGPDRPLDTGPENALYPVWSPDGKQIAFLRCGIGPCDIATVPAAGGPVRTVQQLPDYCLPDDVPYYQFRQLNPVWTADGNALIYPYRGLNDNAERLVIKDLWTNTQSPLTTGRASEQDAAPALSPDGKSVAFLRRHLNWTQVMTINLKSHATRVLETEPNVAVSGVTWSPDGRGVVVGVNRRKGLALLWVPLNGTIKYLDVNIPLVNNPVFSGDGKSLMVLALNRSRNMSAVIGANGLPNPVLRSKQRNAATAFSPDKRKLAFLTDRSGTWEVWVAGRQENSFLEPHQLTEGLAWYPSSIAWSPNGELLAVGISNTNQIQMVDAHTGGFSLLRLPGMEHSVVWSPVWSLDGRWIYFSAWGEKNGIFRASAGPVPAVTQVMAGNPREIRVANEQTLIFEPDYGHGLYSVALDGKSAPIPLPGLIDILPARAWFVEDGKLYYLNVHDAERRLHQYDLISHSDTLLTQPLPRVVFSDGTLSYDPVTKLLIYPEWTEAAGSQIMSLRWGK